MYLHIQNSVSEWFNKRRPPRYPRNHLKFDRLARGGSLYFPGMERTQEPAIRASLFDGVYRPAFIVGTPHYGDLDTKLNAPQPLSVFLDPLVPQLERSSLESASATRPGLVSPPAAYSDGPQGMMGLRGMMTKQPPRASVRVSVRTGWKGYARVEKEYLHPDDKFVDTVPIFAHRTRSGR
jgi:hypothetical protein